MKKTVILTLLALALAATAFGQGKTSPEDEIRAVLEAQQAAWNPARRKIAATVPPPIPMGLPSFP